MATLHVQLATLGGTVSATAEFDIVSGVKLGLTASPQDTATDLKAFPNIAYMRDFGDDEEDPDVLTELTPQGTGKSGLAGTGDITFHFSWTDDVELLIPWLDKATRPFYLSWTHEPMKKTTPAVFRSTCKRMVEILNAHPRKALCLGNGPIVTRYWLDHAGNPADWWYEGATFYGTDCYNGDSTRYRNAMEMFGSAAKIARDRKVPWMVPEYGIERIATDKTGAGRAQAMRDHIAWINGQPDCLAVGWWNRGGDRITGMEPEQGVLRELLKGQ